jgi:hypothetical protein
MNRALSRVTFRSFLVGALALGAAPANAQTLSDKLAVHGYMTQGYAAADSHQIVGIPRGGTFDYRRAAILFRFKATPNDAFVVQLANRELGESPIDDFSQGVQLDWAFYERKLGSRTTVRIGKAPIPIGIFNETRYVGTLLPFYRAPLNFYEEGSFTSETLNGVVLSRQITPDSRWKLSGALFGGGFEYLQAGSKIAPGDSVSRYIVTRATAKNLIGAQFWLQTPVTGLRVGLGGDHRDDYGVFHGATAGTHDAKEWWTGAEGVFDRFTVRSEYREYIFNNGGIQSSAYYGQAGFRILDALSVNVQRDMLDLRIATPGGTLRIPYSRDNAIGLDYSFTPNIVAKIELHDDHGFASEEPMDVLHGQPVRSRYYITSLSVTF